MVKHLISHRGNIDGPNVELENSIEYIKKAIDLGYDVEIDVWYHDKSLYLGHDGPSQLITEYSLYSMCDNLWIHCKNLGAIAILAAAQLRLCNAARTAPPRTAPTPQNMPKVFQICENHMQSSIFVSVSYYCCMLRNILNVSHFGVKDLLPTQQGISPFQSPSGTSTGA